MIYITENDELMICIKLRGIITVTQDCFYIFVVEY